MRKRQKCDICEGSKSVIKVKHDLNVPNEGGCRWKHNIICFYCLHENGEEREFSEVYVQMINFSFTPAL